MGTLPRPSERRERRERALREAINRNRPLFRDMSLMTTYGAYSAIRDAVRAGIEEPEDWPVMELLAAFTHEKGAEEDLRGAER